MAEKKSGEPKIKGNSLGASGFTLGVVALISLGWFGVIVSLVGLGLCIVQQKNKKTKLGKAGIIINLIALVFSIVFIFYLAPIIAEWMTSQFPSA